MPTHSTPLVSSKNHPLTSLQQAGQSPRVEPAPDRQAETKERRNCYIPRRGLKRETCRISRLGAGMCLVDISARGFPLFFFDKRI